MRRDFPVRTKAQAALEFLTTYSWMFIILVVILAALYQLGIFSSSGVLSPRAPPGGCQVARSGLLPTLAGSCQGEEPEFVAGITGSSGTPITANILNPTYFSSGTSPVSIFAWVKTTSTTSWGRVAGYGSTLCNSQGSYLEINPNGLSGSIGFDSGCGVSAWTNNVYVNDNVWNFVGFTMPNGGQAANVILYLNGVAKPIFGDAVGATTINSVEVTIGWGPSVSITGDIADVQIYNSSLSAAEVLKLYQEGIGGAPIDPLYLVGWYPLNGNAADYSGLLNNGYVQGVNYVSTWTAGYTQP